jgi:LysR family nitrogen assimilation transcriptional regulator
VEILELRYFAAVAEAGNFSRAAVKLNMTQPALSRQIRKLEDELHTSLFYRDGRGVSLTEVGGKLLDATKPILQQLSDIKDDIVENSERPSGIVVLGVPPSIGNSLAAPLAQRFREVCPGATLRVREGFSSTLLEWIEAGRLDVAVLYDARRDRNLLVSPMLLEDFFLIQPKSRSVSTAALTMADIANLELVLPGPENGFRRVVDAAARAAHVELMISMEIDSVAALKQLVRSSTGLATILPFGAVHQEVLDRRLVARPIASSVLQAMLVTATPPHRPVTRAGKTLVRLIHSEVRRCVAAGTLRGRIDALSLRHEA